MPDPTVTILVALAVATTLNVLLKRFSIPTVIGYIFTGTILAPVFSIPVQGNDPLAHIAEFGVVFLMFTIGLEFSFSQLVAMRREVLAFGTAQVFVTALVVAGVATVAFHIAPAVAVVLGAGLALSSTAIVLKLLNERGQMKSEVGRNSLGILLFQDIAVIPILLLITLLSSEGESMGALLLETAKNGIITLVVLVGLGKSLLGFFFRAVSGSGSKEIFMGLILFVVLGASWVAHHFGFSYSLGAFVAGMMIADSLHRYQVEADLIPFRDLLLGVFFVTVGLQIDLGVVLGNVLPIAGLVVGLMVLKAVIIAAILRISCSTGVSLKTAITLSQVGEFALVVFSVLRANDLLDPTQAQILIVTVAVSMILTPVLILNADRLVGWLTLSSVTDTDASLPVMGEHIVLCGYDAFGRAVSDRLEAAGINQIVIANNTDDYVQARKRGLQVVYGDPSDRLLMERVGIRKAIGTVIGLDDLDKTKQISAAVALVDPDLKIIAKVSTEEDRKELARFNHELVVDGNSHTAAALVDQIVRSRLLAQQTASLQFLDRFDLDLPADAIDLVMREQARLLWIMNSSFAGMRDDKDVMTLKAFHDSHVALGEIVKDAMRKLVTQGKLSAPQVERVNLLMDNQHLLESMNALLERLGYELRDLQKDPKTSSFARMVVEGLDAILLSLMDVATEPDPDEMAILRNMTSVGRGLSRIRETYLGADHELGPESRARLLAATNHIDRLRVLFGSVGDNYERLAGSPAPAPVAVPAPS